MSDDDDLQIEITPEILLRAYACGIFPMSESADDPSIFWVEPELRGIIPLNEFHIPRSLKKAMRREDWGIFIDRDFAGTIEACSEPIGGRESTWINQEIKKLYQELHKIGHAHSFEVYLDDEMVGGLYGVRLGRAFFGESMFSRRTDASKIALVHLVYQMHVCGFELLDTQFITPHLERFGAKEIPKMEYQTLLETALTGDEAMFDIETNQDGGATLDSILQLFSQIS